MFVGLAILITVRWNGSDGCVWFGLK